MNIRNKKERARDAEEFLDGLLGGPVTFGEMLYSLRICQEVSQIEFAEKLGISRSHLCDIEKGRKLVSPQKAAQYAKVLHNSILLFVQTALQDQVNQVNVPYIVKLEKLKAA